MVKKICLAIIFITHSFALSQEKMDYELVGLINSIGNQQLFIYNILDSGDDKIYLGTDRGAYEFDGYRIEKLNNLSGYIEFDLEQEITTSSRDINQFNLKSDYSFLIEAESNLDDLKIQSITKSNLLFILYNGSLRVYRKKIFKRKLQGRSIRSISENYIGTYSGIFNHNEELISEILTDSYLREFNNNLYICFNGLAFIEGDKTIVFDNEKQETFLFGRNLGFSKDIFQFRDSFLLFTTKGVYKTDLVSYLDILIDTSEFTEELDRKTFSKFISYYQDKGYNDFIYFYANNSLYKYFIENGKLLKETTINDVLYLEQNDLYIYFLDLDGLKVYSLNEGIRPILENDKNYHSFSLIGNSRFILVSDAGLDIYDLSSGKRKTLITQEFNYGSIYKDESSILLGTTNGYLTASIQELKNLPIINISNQDYGFLYIILIAFFFVVVIILIIKLVILKKKYDKKIIVNSNTEKKEDIEKFISQNLSSITVNLIQNQFKISYRQLSKLFSSPSLAKFIEIERKKILKEGINQGLSIEEISKQTGYSTSYLKRIKRTNRN